jgi:hypothetical protein
MSERTHDVVKQIVHPLIWFIMEYEIGTPRDAAFQDSSVLLVHGETSSEDMGTSMEHLSDEVKEALENEEPHTEEEAKIIEKLQHEDDEYIYHGVTEAINYLIEKLKEHGALVDIEYR